MDVIIPARNEADNIERVLIPFVNHPFVSQVIVSIDADTTDDTDMIAERWASRIFTGTKNRGKGQCVANALYLVRTPRVIFCDADVTGLTPDHISCLMHPNGGMVVGVPDFPSEAELLLTGQPKKWRRRLEMSWHMVTGQRSVLTEVARSLPLHGYLMETQLNKAHMEGKMPIDYCRLNGLRSPFLLTDERLSEMERDRQWGFRHGVLPVPERAN
jgi:glycosyltransferase involved in cell wall biosynthesis